MAPALVLEDVRFTYRGAVRPALDGLSLAVEEGETVWLLGASGSGRSTLALATNRIVPLHQRGAFSGRLFHFGQPAEGRTVSELAGIVGEVFQDFESQIFGTRVDLEAAFGCENLGVPPKEMRRRVREALERVGLAGFEQRDPVTLSGGEKQRLVIASVLAMQPKVLMLDEPTTDLDPLGRAAVWDVLRELKGQRRTLLLIEPETDEADLGERIVVLEEGRKAEDGPSQALLARASLLERLGVRAPDLAALSERLALREPQMSVEAMAEEITHAGMSLDLRATQRILAGGGQAGAGEEVLRFEGVHHSYDGNEESLAGVDLVFREGEFAAILGGNGSGKTTLAQLACGLLLPSRGRVLLRSEDVARIPVSLRGGQVGFVFQNPDQQIFAPTVREEVSFAPRNFGFDESAVESALKETLETVGLEGSEELDPFVMTRGDRQRVAVASTLAAGPRLLIMDEPTTGLDHRDQQRIMTLLGRLRDEGRTIIVITHAIGLASRWAGRLVVLHQGRVVADGPTREVLSSSSLIRQSAIRPPRIVQLALRLGAPLLSVEELAGALQGGRSRES